MGKKIYNAQSLREKGIDDSKSLSSCKQYINSSSVKFAQSDTQLTPCSFIVFKIFSTAKDFLKIFCSGLESASLWVVILARIRLPTLGSPQIPRTRDHTGSCCCKHTVDSILQHARMTSVDHNHFLTTAMLLRSYSCKKMLRTRTTPSKALCSFRIHSSSEKEPFYAKSRRSLKRKKNNNNINLTTQKDIITRYSVNFLK